MRKINSFLWCSVHPNHYHQYLLECLQKANITVDALYFNKVIQKYPWKTDFSNESASYLQRGFLGIDWPFIFSGKWKSYRFIVVAGWNEPTMILLLFLLILSKKKYILYSDTPEGKKRTGFKQALRKKWLNLLFGKASFIFSTGKPGINWFLENEVPSYKLVNFPFLTNLDYFKPLPKNVDNDDIPIIFASGRLDNNHKGYDLALDALFLINKEGFSFKYYIAGDGPDRYLIKEKINQLGLQKQVNILGWIEPDTLLKEYQKADIFLHASRFDPYPNAVLEAMAVALPVICSDNAGSGVDRIKHGVNGMLFKSNDVNDLASQLRSLLNFSASKRQEMGRKARETAEEWNFMYHVKTLKKILNEH